MLCGYGSFIVPVKRTRAEELSPITAGLSGRERSLGDRIRFHRMTLRNSHNHRCVVPYWASRWLALGAGVTLARNVTP